MVNYWEECCGGGSVGSETVLCVGKGDGVELRELESLQHLDGGTQEGDGTVAAGLGGRFSRFEDRDNYCMFPNSGDSTVIEGKVKKVGKVLQPKGSKVLEVEDGEAIRSSGTRFATIPDGPGDEVSGVRIE